MKKSRCYENYPEWIILVANLVSILIYITGAYIIIQLGLIWLILYLGYILLLEFKVMSKSCTHCYYYGKACAFGLGKLSAIFFKKKADNLGQCQITRKDILPDFLVSLIPIFIGIVLLIMNFDIWILLALILLILLTSMGNGLVRSSLACKHCKQRKLGCPAEKLFQKKK